MEKALQSQILNVSGSSFSDLCLVARDTPPFKDADDRWIKSGKDKKLEEGGKDAPEVIAVTNYVIYWTRR